MHFLRYPAVAIRYHTSSLSGHVYVVPYPLLVLPLPEVFLCFICVANCDLCWWPVCFVAAESVTSSPPPTLSVLVCSKTLQSVVCVTSVTVLGHRQHFANEQNVTASYV